jgi:uncharacterized protein YndB with AHSA1/START domain
MSTAQQASQDPGLTVQVRRILAFPREKVFAAWADPRQLEKWIVRDVPSHVVTHHRQDIRTGGGYLLEVRDPGKNEIYWGHGDYREVTPPSKIVFTWCWTKGSPDGPNMHPGSEVTQVTVEFFERGSHATEIVLTHGPFSSEKLRNDHNRGWNGCFDVLEQVLRSEGSGASGLSS